MKTLSGTLGSATMAYAGSTSSPITYASHHAIPALPLGNEITETRSYNDRLQQTGVQAGSLLTLTFYPCDGGVTACTNNNGNIWRETVRSTGMSGVATQEYRYDALNRLAVAVENPSGVVTASSACSSLGGAWCQQFGYDAYGNRWVNTYSGITPAANTPLSASGFDAANHLTANSAQMDARGNLQQIGGANGQSFTYDAENRLTAVKSGSTTIASYAYDGDGRRVQKATGGTTTTYVYDAQGEMAAEYSSGTVPASPCAICYITVDNLGSTRMMTDGNGNAVALHDYQPFGEEIAGGIGGRSPSLYDQIDNPSQKFTGKERDAETANSADPNGLDFFGGRYFSGAQGRFTSVDPAFESAILELPQTWNRYSYVYNRPTFGTDPDGRCPICVGAIVGGVVEGGWNLGSQFIEHGYSFSGTDWGQVGANFVGGAVAGGLAVATGGTSLLSNALAGDVAAGAVSTVAGGIVTRTAEGQSAGEVFSPGDIATDAVAGFVGGAGGHVAADFIHVPEEPGLPGSRRHAVGRRKLAKYDAAVGARNNALRIQAGIGVAAASPPTHGVTGFINNFWNTLDWLVFTSPPPAPAPATTIFHPCGQGDTSPGCQ